MNFNVVKVVVTGLTFEGLMRLLEFISFCWEGKELPFEIE
jgi:hypothetical protein